jgi:hypothetical protein
MKHRLSIPGVHEGSRFGCSMRPGAAASSLAGTGRPSVEIRVAGPAASIMNTAAFCDLTVSGQQALDFQARDNGSGVGHCVGLPGFAGLRVCVNDSLLRAVEHWLHDGLRLGSLRIHARGRLGMSKVSHAGKQHQEDAESSRFVHGLLLVSSIFAIGAK